MKMVTQFRTPHANLEEERAAKATKRFPHHEDPHAEAEGDIHGKTATPCNHPRRKWRNDEHKKGRPRPLDGIDPKLIWHRSVIDLLNGSTSKSQIATSAWEVLAKMVPPEAPGAGEARNTLSAWAALATPWACPDRSSR